MFTERLNEWKIKNNTIGCEVDEDIFSIFYQESNVGKGFMQMLCDLAYAIYQHEVCIEGLIEDMEYIDGEKSS